MKINGGREGNPTYPADTVASRGGHRIVVSVSVASMVGRESRESGESGEGRVSRGTRVTRVCRGA